MVVKIELKDFPKAISQVVKVIAPELESKVVNRYLIFVKTSMELRLRPYRRQIAVEGMHLSDSFHIVPRKGVRYGAAIESDYPRKPVLVARSVETGRVGYSKPRPFPIIKGRREYSPALRREVEGWEPVFVRRVGPSDPRPFIEPSVREHIPFLLEEGAKTVRTIFINKFGKRKY